MNIIDIITKKKNNEPLTMEEIKYVIENYLNDNIKDYQMSSLLMAIVLNGMNEEEINCLTKIMLESGDRIDLTSLGTAVADKHSTGGVGDKTTLIVAPLVASCGVKVAKMSGRGLGHTGGTIDKLEAIPGFVSNLTEEEFLNQVNNIGLSIITSTKNLVPADKKIYALRDVTGTVESPALIASSIMSKKIASGSHNLVLDIKVGSGALIKDLETAKELANIMIKIGNSNNMKVICLLTNMDIPLGNNIGNTLEVEEAINILMGKTDGPLKELCVAIASYMVSLGLNISYEEAEKQILDNLKTGKAYTKFLEFVQAQHGDLSKMTKKANIYQVKTNKPGYLTNIDAYKLGRLSMELGAGRENKEDTIDYSAGIIINKKINDYLNIDDVVYTVYTNKDINNLKFDIFTLSETPIENPKLIYEIIK